MDLIEALRAILRIGCLDVSSSIGLYFSCTESVIKIGEEAGLPVARSHLFQLVMYFLQYHPFELDRLREPEESLEEILSKAVRKGGFVGYHYMILANALLNQSDFIGDKYYLHSLAGLEVEVSSMRDEIPPIPLGSRSTR